MDTLLSVLHVVTAVFLIGPMAILPMTAMRAIRAGEAKQVAVLAKSTFVTSLLSLLVVVFGFGAMAMADEKYDLSITTPWILWSLIAYLVALALTVLVVVPAMRGAADELAASGTTDKYGKVAAFSGIATLLLVVTVVLMVWKP